MSDAHSRLDPCRSRHISCVPPQLDRRDITRIEPGDFAFVVLCLTRAGCRRSRPRRSRIGTSGRRSTWGWAVRGSCAGRPQRVNCLARYATASPHYGRSRNRFLPVASRNYVAVRHASGDSLVAVVEIVSPGNKSSRSALRAFVEKAAEFLDRRIHMLVADLHPPTSRDPQGIHGAIWEEVAGLDYTAPADEPLTLAAYESGSLIRAFVEPISVGDALKSMPLYLEPDGYVLVPLESTYAAAFAAQPKRWRTVLTATTR